MRLTGKIISAVAVVVFLMQGALSGPVRSPQNYYYGADNNGFDGFGDEFPNPFDVMDYPNIPTQATYVDSNPSSYSSPSSYNDYDGNSGFQTKEDNDYDGNSGFQTEESFAYAVVQSGPSLSDFHAYKNGEPVSADQIPDRFKNFKNHFKNFDNHFKNFDNRFKNFDNGFKNFNPFKFVDKILNDDDSSDKDAFGNDIFGGPLIRKGLRTPHLRDDLSSLLNSHFSYTTKRTQKMPHVKEF